MSSQPHNHGPQPTDGLEPEFSPDDPLERRLLADGARWRAHTAPPVEPFARRVNAALRESRRQADTFEEEQPMSQRIVTPPTRVASQPPRRRPGTWNTLVAIAAAIAIVATLAWIFQAIPHLRLAGNSATPTPQSTAHVTHSRGHWADVVQYTLSSSGTVYVASSDPRIAFRTIAPQSDPTATTLARTTDGGATWTMLALPTDDGGWFGGLAISPLDSQTVFLTLGGDQNNPHCPAYALGPGADVGPAVLKAANAPHADALLGPLNALSGGYGCSFQYVSRDGGVHWAHPTFPWRAQHLADSGANISPLQTQGSTLFAAVTGDLNGPAYAGVRLASSTDGGTTWSVADADIFATGQIVTSYTAIAGTTTLYALSVPQQTQYNQLFSATVWSSEDAGAHWARVGTCPLFQAGLIGTTSTPGGPTLYALRMDTYPGGPLPIYVSRTSGRTWSPVPTNGWPQLQIFDPSTPQVLADGSVVLEFPDVSTAANQGMAIDNTNISFLGWRPGDTGWFQVAPRTGNGTVVHLWLTTPANGPQTLWIVVATQQSTIYTVRKCVLD